MKNYRVKLYILKENIFPVKLETSMDKIEMKS